MIFLERDRWNMEWRWMHPWMNDVSRWLFSIGRRNYWGDFRVSGKNRAHDLRNAGLMICQVFRRRFIRRFQSLSLVKFCNSCRWNPSLPCSRPRFCKLFPLRGFLIRFFLAFLAPTEIRFSFSYCSLLQTYYFLFLFDRVNIIKIDMTSFDRSIPN